MGEDFARPNLLKRPHASLVGVSSTGAGVGGETGFLGVSGTR